MLDRNQNTYTPRKLTWNPRLNEFLFRRWFYSSPLKIDGLNTTFLLERPIFRCYVSFFGSLSTIKSVYFHQTWKKTSSFSKSFNGFSGALLIFFSVLVCCSNCKSCPLVSICFSSNASNFCTACVERDQAWSRGSSSACVLEKNLGNLGEMFTIYNMSVTITNSSHYMNNIIKNHYELRTQFSTWQRDILNRVPSVLQWWEPHDPLNTTSDTPHVLSDAHFWIAPT